MGDPSLLAERKTEPTPPVLGRKGPVCRLVGVRSSNVPLETASVWGWAGLAVSTFFLKFQVSSQLPYHSLLHMRL